MKQTFRLFLLIVLIVLSATAQQKRAIAFDDLIGFGRVSDPQISPDGNTVAFVVTSYNKAENTSNGSIYLIPIDGGQVRQLTTEKKANNTPRWMPDGKSIAFVSNRDGQSQIWVVSVTGGEARRVTTISTEASGLAVSPDGKYFAFHSDVYPDLSTDSANRARNEHREKSKVKAKIFATLPYRVWDDWKDDKRSHVFVSETSGGQPKDLTPGNYDSPPIDIGGEVDFAFSPDGKELCFVRNTDPMVAVSTNNDLFVVPVAGGEAKRITENKATDNQPVYSPSGKYIAYRAMVRPGFEADRYRLMLYERATGSLINLTEGFDRSVDDVIWSPDEKSLYFDADDQGYHSIYCVDVATHEIKQLTNKVYASDLRIAPDGRTLVFAKQSINRPAEVYRMDIDGENLTQLSHVNDEKIAQLEMNPVEDFWFTSGDGTKIHGLIVKPPFFDQRKKYPMVYLIHGGPQGQWPDAISYRWCAEMFASPGYVVVMVNPRGSTGYGQKFTDEISGDWGGKVFDDLMRGVDTAVARYSFIDRDRLAAAGASYGGYMINWIEGHPNPFKCLISHDGDFNTVSSYGTTEELWFPEWEFKGTPWTNPELYAKWSPSSYVKNFKTPMLIIHGQKDFRVDISEGFQTFTALQRMKVPSKFLYFPDEGHWVLKPQNSELWYKAVLDWIAQWIEEKPLGTMEKK
ncbi:MAG: S9 family peptidase [Bacteroidota bacterium]